MIDASCISGLSNVYYGKLFLIIELRPSCSAGGVERLCEPYMVHRLTALRKKPTVLFSCQSQAACLTRFSIISDVMNLRRHLFSSDLDVMYRVVRKKAREFYWYVFGYHRPWKTLSFSDKL
jgi:hypothetical protein